MAGHQDNSEPNNLVKLPPEIFEKIAQLVDPADLLSIRLLCREAAAKVLRTYQSTHFTEHALLLCDDLSLRTLVDIAKTPHLGACLRKIIICVDAVPKPPPEGWDTSGWRPWRREWQRQEGLRKRGDDLQLLATAFTQLRAYVNHSLHIEVTEAATSGNPPACCNILDETINNLIVTDRLLGNRALEVTLEALARSGLRVHSFSAPGMGHVAHRWRPEIEALVLNGNAMSNGLAVFRDLTYLYVGPRITVGTLTVQQADDFVANFCASCHLKELRIESQTYVDFPRFMIEVASNHELAGALMRADFPALERLVLSGMRVNLNDFLGFVRRQNSLTSLALRKVAFQRASGEHFSVTDEGVADALKQWTGLKDVSVT